MASDVVLRSTWNWSDDKDNVSCIAILDITAIPEMRSAISVSFCGAEFTSLSSSTRKLAVIGVVSIMHVCNLWRCCEPSYCLLALMGHGLVLSRPAAWLFHEAFEWYSLSVYVTLWPATRTAYARELARISWRSAVCRENRTSSWSWELRRQN